MSGVLTRARLIPQERYDLEDFLVDQNAIRTDSKFWTQRFLSDGNYIIKGFEVSGIGLKNATISMDRATLIHGENTFDFSWFTSPITFTDIVIEDASLQDGVKNYLEIKLVEVDGTPVTKTFWDPAANGGVGAEFNQEINTTTDLEVLAEVSVGGFSSDPDKIPLAIIEVDALGNIVGILDRRKMYFRLGQPDNIDREFTWDTQEEPTISMVLSSVVGSFTAGETITFSGGATAIVAVGGTTPIEVRYLDSTSLSQGNTLLGSDSGATAILTQYTESFVKADKDIKDFKDNDDAIKTEIKNVKGTRQWYQNALNSISGLARFQNSCISSALTGAQWRWNGSNLSITQAQQPEITSLLARNDAAGDLDGTYFITYDQNGSVGWWIDVDDSGTTAPAGALAADRQVEITTINTNDLIGVVASKLQAAIDLDSEYSAILDSDTVIITDANIGDRIASVDGDTGFTITRTQRGLGTLTPNDSDVLAKLRILGELADLNITRQDGSGGSISIPISDNQVVFITLPNAGSSRTFSGVGVLDTEFQVVNIEDFIPGDDKYWIAFREGEQLCFRSGDSLGIDEEVGIGSGVTEDTITYIGSAGPNDPTPNYQSTEIITQGANLTFTIAELDAQVKANLDAIGTGPSIPRIEKPVNQSPVNGSIEIPIPTTLIGGTYFPLYSPDIHVETDWELERVSDGALIFSSFNDAVNLTSIVATGLTQGVEYRWRNRYRSQEGFESEWSDFTTYTAFTSPITTPTIIFPTNGEIDVDFTAAFTSDAFASTGGDIHEGTDYQITLATDPLFLSPIVDIVNDTVNKTSRSFDNSLFTVSTNYICRIRYKGDINGYSGYSAVHTFTTAAIFPASTGLAISQTVSPFLSIYSVDVDTLNIVSGEPSTLPPTLAFRANYSSDGEYLVVPNNNGCQMFKITGQDYDLIPNAFYESGVPTPLPINCYCAHFSRDGSLLAICGNFFAKVYKKAVGLDRWDLQQDLIATASNDVKFSPGGTHLLIGGSNAQMWKSTDGGSTWTNITATIGTLASSGAFGVDWASVNDKVITNGSNTIITHTIFGVEPNLTFTLAPTAGITGATGSRISMNKEATKCIATTRADGPTTEGFAMFDWNPSTLQWDVAPDIISPPLNNIGAIFECNFEADSNYFLVGNLAGGSPHFYRYKFDGVNTWNRLADPVSLPNNCNGIAVYKRPEDGA